MTAQRERIPLPQTAADLYASFLPKQVDPDTFEVITGRGNIPLADAVGRLLGKTVHQPCDDFADEETGVEIHQNLRGREVFILQSMTPRPNDRIQEAVLIADAARRASAGKITAMLPYYAYARQDRKPTSRTPISAARVAKQLIHAGVNTIFTIDIHAEQSEGSIDEAWDNVYSDKVIVPKVEELGLEDIVVIAPDSGSVKRAVKFAGHLNGTTDVAFVDKRRDLHFHDTARSDKLVGDVEGRPVVIFDDLISTGGTLEGAAELAKKGGAVVVYTAAAHGLFVPDKSGTTLPQKLEKPNFPIDKIIVTDSILQSEYVQQHDDKIDVVSVAPMLAVAVFCYLTRDSIGERLIK